MAWAFMNAKAPVSLRAQAMRFLARREHSREELRRKLATKVEEGDNLEAVLDELAAKGWLSDARYAEHTLRAKARRYGPLKLQHYLKSRGVDEQSIAAGLHAAGADGAPQLETIWKSRFREAPQDEREKARQVRFLQGRGFALDAIFRFLKSLRASR
jgi:regulatory protein